MMGEGLLTERRPEFHRRALFASVRRPSAIKPAPLDTRSTLSRTTRDA